MTRPWCCSRHRAGRPEGSTCCPTSSYPTLTVRTEYTGAAPSEVETLISEPAEEALGVVRTAQAQVGLAHRAERRGAEFAWGTDMDQASLEVRDRSETLQLPLDAPRRCCRLQSLDLRRSCASMPSKDAPVGAEDAKAPPVAELRRFADEDLKKKAWNRSTASPRSKVGGGLEDEVQGRDRPAQAGAARAVGRYRRPAPAAGERQHSGGRLEEGSAALPRAHGEPVHRRRGRDARHARDHAHRRQRRRGQRGCSR